MLVAQSHESHDISFCDYGDQHLRGPLRPRRDQDYLLDIHDHYGIQCLLPVPLRTAIHRRSNSII